MKRFQQLLLKYSQEPHAADRKRIEEGLWNEYGTECTVFILDMSGFSVLTRRYGIVHYLSMIHHMQITAQPIVESFGGSVVKFEADNCFAVFPDPLSAVQAAIAMQLAFDASNLITPDDADIYISVGIDCGKILLIENVDCFGDAVNRASKLGEDIGTAGEILVTKEAMKLIPPEAEIKSREIQISISGIYIAAFAVEYEA